MKPKIKEITLRDDVYHRHLTILIGGDAEWLKEFAKKKLNEDLILPNTTDGCHFDHVENGQIYYFIWLQTFDRSPQAISTLGHEIIHFCFSALANLQVPIKESADEVFAYFFQSYFQRALNSLLSKK